MARKPNSFARPPTQVRNTAIPKATPMNPAPQRKTIAHDQIARRAYEIYLSGKGGTPDENWLRAERELRGY
ncbi:MAG: DUF2934 domain-containing protein [Tepidisphaeraceae bacterium]